MYMKKTEFSTTSIHVPINREPRTLAQKLHSTWSNLENSFSRQAANALRSSRRDNWFEEVQQWVDSSWKRWDDEMKRIQKNLFDLLPVESWGVQSVNDFQNVADSLGLKNRMMDVIISSSNSDFLKDAYELGDDGKIYFKLRFDVGGFEAEDIRVEMTGYKLLIIAKKVAQDDSSKNMRQFCRVIELPQSIDNEQLQCRLTEDGVLILEAIVRRSDYKSFKFNESGRLGIKPKDEKDLDKGPCCKTLTVQGTPGISVLFDGKYGKRLHLEVPVDPAFKPKDLCVTVDSHRIRVSGKRRYTDVDYDDESVSRAEFIHTYDIPETVDPMTVNAAVINQTLVVDAPLRSCC